MSNKKNQEGRNELDNKEIPFIPKFHRSDQNDTPDKNEKYADFTDEYHKTISKCRTKHNKRKFDRQIIILNPQDNSSSLHYSLKNLIAKMLNDMDYGPDQQERTIINPSMYCYVDGLSKINNKINTRRASNDLDRYYWLPSEFYIDSNGKTKINSYINNLDDKKYPDAVPLIQELFTSMIPALEQVLELNLKNMNLQVVTKINNIHFSWIKQDWDGDLLHHHTEGLLHEYIDAICTYIVDYVNLKESHIKFKKRVPCGSGSREETDLVECEEGRSIIFSNLIKHCNNGSSWLRDKKNGSRTTIEFYVVNPYKRIISTKDVEPQQKIFDKYQALYYCSQTALFRLKTSYKGFVDA